MKIVMIGPVHPYRGGIAQYTSLMSRSLGKEHEVRVISFRFQYPSFLYPGKDQKDETADTFRLPGVEFLINTLNPVSWIRTARRIRRLQPDLLVCQWWHPYFAPAFWSILKAAGKQTRVLFVCHNVLPHEPFLLQKMITRMVLRRGDGFVVHSAQDEAQLERLITNPVSCRTVLPAFDAFQAGRLDRREARRLLGLGGREEVLLFFGFIREYKGLKTLLQAMPVVMAARKNARLLIVGDFFENRDAYLDLIAQSGCADRITLVEGYTPDDQVEKYFCACDLVVLPYLSATQSGIVPIAYGFGKPVVSTDVGGLPEVVIDGKTGYVVPAGSVQGLADAVIRFFSGRNASRFKTHIKAEAARYSWDHMNEVVAFLWNRLSSR